ncbi:MAG TPA: tetratricopeptide repeat protein [Deltaproteobacteria bacterium]|nr:tetratricopeptide repeat protein [Deltaproteobacteria bacterium]HPR53796.1 tetratricopeptide repeat protein [Deltaproteobacteria bacterium]HXK46004.1 tetratricopeptide repeat protein [Deltaproteobacteria bacterium]
MMKRLTIGIVITLLAIGCASQFKERRELSRPMVALAMGKIQENEIQGALIELRKAAAANPTDPEVYYAYALAYWKSGKFDKAIENVDKAIVYGKNIEVEHPGLTSEAYNLKGTILVAQAKYDESIPYFKKALEDELYQTPEFVLYNLANVYLQKKLLPLAFENAQKALEHNPHYAPAWHLLSKIYVAQGHPNDAVDALKHAILEFPGYAEARWDLATLYLQMGARELAKEQLVEVVQLDPGGTFGVMAVEKLKGLE